MRVVAWQCDAMMVDGENEGTDMQSQLIPRLRRMSAASACPWYVCWVLASSGAAGVLLTICSHEIILMPSQPEDVVEEKRQPLALSAWATWPQERATGNGGTRACLIGREQLLHLRDPSGLAQIFLIRGGMGLAFLPNPRTQPWASTFNFHSSSPSTTTAVSRSHPSSHSHINPQTTLLHLIAHHNPKTR